VDPVGAARDAHNERALQLAPQPHDEIRRCHHSRTGRAGKVGGMGPRSRLSGLLGVLWTPAPAPAPGAYTGGGRGLHSFTFQLNLSGV